MNFFCYCQDWSFSAQHFPLLFLQLCRKRDESFSGFSAIPETKLFKNPPIGRVRPPAGQILPNFLEQNVLRFCNKIALCSYSRILESCPTGWRKKGGSCSTRRSKKDWFWPTSRIRLFWGLNFEFENIIIYYYNILALFSTLRAYR